MTTTTLISHTVGSLQTSFFSAFASHLAELCAGAREGLEIEARYDALARKSDTDLAAAGLTRADVAQAALTHRRC
jgi:hypothetical protein